ncbi:MAG: glycerol-3-phosphate 1-O-acyltransferase PlsY [Lachnospiraceae bacterium]|nr:glycerol-3-phosphate 1-O-acyltransferase PlsY [Lachnospiraceae bacterium]
MLSGLAARFGCIVIGYLFGMIQTSYILGRIKGIDIREHGSGNAGTTNALRILGKKAGIITFFVDLGKGAAATLLVRAIMMNFYPDAVNLFVCYGMLGAALGHNFPFYLHFKGGKGIAVTGGCVIGFCDPVFFFIGLTLFLVVVIATRYVSLGSILLMFYVVIYYSIFAFKGHFGFENSEKMLIESLCVICVIAFMGLYRHKENIKRLIHHEERKLGEKKKEE